MSDEKNNTPIPNRAIHEAHLNTLEARQLVAVADDPNAPKTNRDGEVVGPSPREQLQKSVTLYFETLRSYLVSTPEGRRFFKGEPPEDADDLGRGVISVVVEEESVDLPRLPAPPDDVTDLEARQHYEDAIADLLREHEQLAPPVVFDEEADPPVAYATVRRFEVGLQNLDVIYDNRREVETEQTQKFGSGKGFMVGVGRDDDDDTELKLELQPLDLLMRAARELDRAASELDLLAETKESDMKPYLRDFDASQNGEATGEVSRAGISGSPEV